MRRFCNIDFAKITKIHDSLLFILAIRKKCTIFAPRFTILNNRAIEKACKGSKKKCINQINFVIMCKYSEKKCKKFGIHRYCCTYINIERLQLTINFELDHLTK